MGKSLIINYQLLLSIYNIIQKHLIHIFNNKRNNLIANNYHFFLLYKI